MTHTVGRWLLATLLAGHTAGAMPAGVVSADEAGPDPGPARSPRTTRPAPPPREPVSPTVHTGPATRLATHRTVDQQDMLQHLLRHGMRLLGTGQADQGHISGRWQTGSIQQGEKVLLHLEQPMTAGSTLLIYRPGAQLTDPGNGEPMGQLAHTLGTLRITGERVERAWRAEIISLQDSVQTGDRLLHDQDFNRDFPYHNQAVAPVRGRLLWLPGETNEAGADQVVVVGLGRRDRVSPGLVVTIVHTPAPGLDPVSGQALRDQPQPIGEATLYLIGEKASLALLGPTSHPVSRGDEAVSR
ncbi:MAG: hypothetical protein H7837_08285 [Magnetococcus sp. MYC-9]